MSCKFIPDIEACSKRDYSKEDLNNFIKSNRKRIGKPNIKSLRHLSKMNGFGLHSLSVEISEYGSGIRTSKAVFEFGHSQSYGTFTIKF